MSADDRPNGPTMSEGRWIAALVLAGVFLVLCFYGVAVIGPDV